MAYITLVKGDDTDFLDNQYLIVNFNTDIDLSGFQAIFKLGNIELIYPDLSPKFVEIVLSNEITASLQKGKIYGTLKLVDTQNRIRTITTVLPFNVITKVASSSQISKQTLQIDIKFEKNEIQVDMNVIGLSKFAAENYLTQIKQANSQVSEKLQSLKVLENNVENLAQETSSKCTLAEKWAIADGLINNIDYSAKYYANMSKSCATQTEQKIENFETLKVSKSGDTMTGELFMNGANIRMYQDGISQAINTRNTGFVLADGAPSKAQAGFRMNSTDANGVITHYYQTDNPTNGDTYTAISNTIYIDGATKYYPFIIGVTSANVPYLKYNGKTMRYITDTYISGTSWYRIYNDGWCEQGGRVTGETVTFLKNFKNTNYMIQKTLASPDQNATQDRTVSFWGLTVSGATTFVASGYWFACGFIE